MTKQETLKILSVLKAAYPNFYKGMSHDELNRIVSLWEAMFADDTYDLVAAAVKMLIATKTDSFPPVIGQIREQMSKLTGSNDMTEAEAWSLVLNAMRRGIYNAKEAFEALPEDVQSGVGSPEVLNEWAKSDMSNLQVIESNFMRSYRAKKKSNREYGKLPESIKSIVDQIGKSWTGRLEGANE